MHLVSFLGRLPNVYQVDIGNVLAHRVACRLPNILGEVLRADDLRQLLAAFLDEGVDVYVQYIPEGDVLDDHVIDC